MKKQLNQCHCDHFDALCARFDKHCVHFDEFRAETESYFTDIKQDMNYVGQRLDSIEKVVVKMDKKFDLVLEITGRHESSISYHGARLGDHEKRIVNLERRVS